MLQAMKFHAAILQPNGAVTGRESRDSKVIGSDAFNHRVMGEFKRLLRENFTDDPVKTGKFRAQFGEFRPVLEWQQFEPLSAFGKFYVRGNVVAASFYLHGFVPELDEIVVEATEALFVNWFGAENSPNACRGLRSITERPVMVVIPASRKVLAPDDWRIIGNLCPCFAAVFFERAEAAIKQIETYWHNRGFRKRGTETDFLRN